MGNTWVLPSISNSMGKCRKLTHWGQLGKFIPILFPEEPSLPSNSNPIVCFITREMHRFPHQYPIALEKTQNPSYGKSLGKWYS